MSHEDATPWAPASRLSPWLAQSKSVLFYDVLESREAPSGRAPCLKDATRRRTGAAADESSLRPCRPIQLASADLVRPVSQSNDVQSYQSWPA